MSQEKIEIPSEYIVPLNMNGLRGRMLRMPPKGKRKREFLLVYGHHSSLERMYGIAEVLHDFGGVTMPDLPGFGGMDSFYKINERPTIDALADYLASFVKLRYRNSRVTLVGFSFGFLIVTRMLQRYPDLEKKIDLAVSLVGFTHRNDFLFTRTRHQMYLLSSRIVSHKFPSFIFRNILLNPSVIRRLYHMTHNAKDKFTGLSAEEYSRAKQFEVHLWRINDVRTHMVTTVEFLKVDNTNNKLSVSACHVGVPGDKYFNALSVENNLKKIFDDIKIYKARTSSHSPSIIGDKQAAIVLFPSGLRRRLARKSQ